MSNKLRWAKLVWADWSDDPALALCSYAAQGIWMRLMCIAAQGTPYGHVTINGRPPSLEELANLMRPKARPERMARLIAELEGRGVAKRGPCGCLISRRMESDLTLFGKRSESAKSRWNKKTDPNLHMQTDLFAYLESESESESHPHSPPQGGRRARGSQSHPPKQSRNAFVDLALEELADAQASDARKNGATVVELASASFAR